MSVDKIELRRLAEAECISSELGSFDNPKLCSVILSVLDELEECAADASRWRCVRNAIPMASPYAVWREGSHVVLGKDADELVDNFLADCKGMGDEC